MKQENPDICVYLIIPLKELDNWNAGKAISNAKIGQTSHNHNIATSIDIRIQKRVQGMATAFSEDYIILNEYCFPIPNIAFGNKMKKADDFLRKLLNDVIACNEISKSKDNKKYSNPWIISAGNEWVYGLKKSHMDQLRALLKEYDSYIDERVRYGSKEDLIDLNTYIQKNPNNNILLSKLNILDETILNTIKEIDFSKFTYCAVDESWLPDNLNYKELSCCIIAKTKEEFEGFKTLLESKGCKKLSVFFINNNQTLIDEFNNKYKDTVNIYTINNIHTMPKFDYIIQNPPYSRSFHLEFFKKGLDMLNPKGKMTIIEPSTWLINIRQNGKAKYYNEIKKLTKGHIYKVIIENYNKEFDTAMYVPFAVTYIDMDKVYDKIDFWCCGEHRVVNNLYGCNMIGDYNMIWCILNKIKSYGKKVGTMKDHIYKEGKTKVDKDTEFMGFADIVGQGGCGSHGYGIFSFNDNEFQKTAFGEYQNSLIDVFCRRTNTKTYQLFGTKQELENWKYFVFNNKIPLFCSIVLVIDQNNTVSPVLCWLTDKQYTDEEIYKLLNITEEEQEFINKTIKKYERHSPWFKRYLCGKDSVSNEEVQKFIDSL